VADPGPVKVHPARDPVFRMRPPRTIERELAETRAFHARLQGKDPRPQLTGVESAIPPQGKAQ
jgi:hypothetical protein